MDGEALRAVHTIGHSSRAIETIVKVFQSHKIEILVDVQR